jgi:predicted phosphodiesterase
MKIAILSDIHGNKIALDAALADIEAVGVDEFWVLGDIVALGPDPVGVLRRLATLQNCHIIRGNTDRYVVTGDRPPPFSKDLNGDSEKIRVYAEIAGTFAWTQGAITSAGWFEWLSQLPLEIHKMLPDGTQCLMVHAVPGKDDGPGIGKGTADTDISKLLEGSTASLICVGHTHQSFYRKVGKWHVLNPGSISNPLPPILQASYMILDASMDGYQVEHRQVDFDREQVISQVQAIKHPGANFIIKHMRGLPK